MTGDKIEIVGDRVTLRRWSRALVSVPLASFLGEIACAAERPPSCGILPDGVRVWRERGDAVAVALEVPPQARTVRWLADDSWAPFGRGASYRSYFLAFPYMELLLVLRRGALTGWQQLYYRREPLDTGEELLLPNLYNVAPSRGQRCWMCLLKLRDLAKLSWPAKMRAVVDHLFNAAFNRSCDFAEEKSYFNAMRTLDPRVSSPKAWEEATRGNPLFPLEVAWQPAETTVGAELAAMLDRVVAPPALETTDDLAAALARARCDRERR